MSFRFFISILLTLCSTVVFDSCNFNKDYSGEIHRLDSLVTSLDSAANIFAQVNVDTLKAMQTTTESQLAYIQKNFVGEMRRDIAAVAGEYKVNRKLLEQTAEKIESGRKETLFTKEQLTHLKQAIVEKATHDAAGNKMDQKYILKALGRERQEAGMLLKGKTVLPENARKAKEKFLLLYPKMQFWVDSIPALVQKVEVSS